MNGANESKRKASCATLFAKWRTMVEIATAECQIGILIRDSDSAHANLPHMAKPRQRTVQVSENGRMNLPSDMRRALGLSGSGRVILTQDEDGVRITTVDHALKRIRELVAPFKREGRSLVDELIAERRAEAARGEQEAGGPANG